MQSRSILRYILFGTGFRYLMDVKEGYPLFGDGYVMDCINRYFNNLDDFELSVTSNASTKLRNIKYTLSRKGQNYRLSKEEARDISKTLKGIRSTLVAETQNYYAYTVTDKRMTVKKLLSNIAGLFAPDVYSNISSIAKIDFEEAGKCISYDLPTAAAFHILRGTEDVLRHLYSAILLEKRGNGEYPEHITWGAIVQNLRSNEFEDLISEILLDNLDNIRKSFRNPTQHPEKIYDIHEAQDLFSLCIDVVNRMVKSQVWITINEEEIPY